LTFILPDMGASNLPKRQGRFIVVLIGAYWCSPSGGIGLDTE